MIKKKVKRKNPDSVKELDIIINQEWDKKSIKLDWLGMESAIRKVYFLLDEEKLSKPQALIFIADIIAAFTKRGPVKGY